jgi:pimeloyl-ACP methyl ester carboxylesterase
MRLRDAALATEGIINSPAATMVGFYEDILGHDRAAACPTYDGIPTRVLVGDGDRLTPPPHARRIAGSIRGARLTIAPGAGHMLPLERDELVSNLLLELVAGALPHETQARRTTDDAPHRETVGPVAAGSAQAVASR